MRNDEQTMLDKYGIGIEQKTIYIYKGFRYDRLEDAIRYAEIEKARIAAGPN